MEQALSSGTKRQSFQDIQSYLGFAPTVGHFPAPLPPFGFSCNTFFGPGRPGGDEDYSDTDDGASAGGSAERDDSLPPEYDADAFAHAAAMAASSSAFSRTS